MVGADVSLLTSGKHPVLVILRHNVKTPLRGLKEWHVSAAPEYVRCGVQAVREWSTSEETFTDGIQMLDLRRMFTLDWPGDINSHVVYDGVLYESVGAPQHQKMGRRTKHWAITLRNIGAPLRAELEECADFLGIPYSIIVTDAGLLDLIWDEALRLWKLARGIV